ncbi:thiolase family protein [Agromyces atrinae]|uniref:thiolase family protein n=1 Tax=Agromyces atrinae TaxID=592376 RepID=UPI001F5ADE7F|nr:thiolase family protein [Agromyces atrinae]MCI2957238.1 thiolase family protein [Agromyces atrinae]
MSETVSGDAVIVAARRTPFAPAGGRLAHVAPHALAASALSACVADLGTVDGGPVDIGDVILGNVVGPAGNLARVATLAARLPLTVPGVTIDRQCASGLTAIALAADAIRAGERRALLAGGVESASTSDTRRVSDGTYRRAAFAPPGFADPDMGEAAQALADRDRITRDRQDSYAERSHRLALSAASAGRFEAELVPLDGQTVDDGPRDAHRRALSRFPARFGGDPRWAVTAGTTARPADGAAVTALVHDSDRGDRPGLLVRVVATVGGDPAQPGLGAVGATRTALDRAGVRLGDVAAIEIVEAYAAQSLAVLDRLELAAGCEADDRVCSDGGTLALGHAWGASGALAVVRLFARLVDGGAPAGSIGLAAASVAGGLGVALIVEVVR